MNFIQDVINLEVYDENGKLVTKIETVTKGSISYRNNDDDSYLLVDDAFYSIKMLEQIGRKEVEEELTDFEKSSNQTKSQTIRFGALTRNAKFKLVGRGIVYDSDSHKVSHDFQITIPNAELANGYNFEFKVGELSSPKYAFRLLPYGDKQDLFELRLTERA